jgi:hypothetical protein
MWVLVKVAGLQHTHTATATHIHIYIPASLKRRQRRVDLQRRAQVPHTFIADVVVTKAAHVQVWALAKVVGLPVCHKNCDTYHTASTSGGW